MLTTGCTAFYYGKSNREGKTQTVKRWMQTQKTITIADLVTDVIGEIENFIAHMFRADC